MFTRAELNVLLQAVSQYRGPWASDTELTLTKAEIAHKKKCLDIADNLRLRFEGILTDYYEIENSYLMKYKIDALEELKNNLMKK